MYRPNLTGFPNVINENGDQLDVVTSSQWLYFIRATLKLAQNRNGLGRVLYSGLYFWSVTPQQFNS